MQSTATGGTCRPLHILYFYLSYVKQSGDACLEFITRYNKPFEKFTFCQDDIILWRLTSLVSQTSAPSVYMTSSFWLPFPGAKRIFFTQPRCVGIPLRTSTALVGLGKFLRPIPWSFIPCITSWIFWGGWFLSSHTYQVAILHFSLHSTETWHLSHQNFKVKWINKNPIICFREVKAVINEYCSYCVVGGP